MTDQPTQLRQRRLADVAIVGCAVFAAILVAMHFIQPELSPLRRFGSEYSVGRMGWLMRLAFFCLSAGMAALAIAIGLTANPSSRSRFAGVLLSIASVGIFLSGVFNADLQGTSVTRTGIVHDLAGFLAFLTLLPGMFVVSRALRRQGVLNGGHSALRILPWTSLLLFLSLLFVFGAIDLAGLGQRLFLTSMVAWLSVTAMGIRSGALFRAR